MCIKYMALKFKGMFLKVQKNDWIIKELVSIGFVEEITPATLSKKLRNHAETLSDKFNIQVEFIRTSDKRILSICDGNDDDDSNIA